VPGFYDGDGQGDDSGNIWKVRFSADQIGEWSYISQSSETLLDGYTGYFDVTNAPANAPDYYRWGRLEYNGTASNKIRYLKFRDGPYWLKAGCDDPENFLGNSPNYDTLENRKAAVDYLSQRGVNSIYIMTHNLDGDLDDVWPWLGEYKSTAKLNGGTNARFNIPKMKEWLELFEYMNIKGMVPYIILEDDSAWTGYDHARYYRELIARFGHIPAMLFNFCEEYAERYSISSALNYMQQLDDIDPYDHPRGIHDINDPLQRLPDRNQYTVSQILVDAEHIHFASIQTGPETINPLVHNQIAIDWINLSNNRGKRNLMVGFDK
jgi:hypothetical protein